ncbi:unnamed protein product, partial [Meganyctiphanes norvegica]
MDKASCHPPSLNDIDELIGVRFLPPNITSLIQPCNQQVMFFLKSLLRNVYYTKFLTHVRMHAELENPYQYFIQLYTLEESVCDLGKYWEDLPFSIIDQSFNNLLKRNLLKEVLVSDFEGFVGEQPRIRRVDFHPQLKDNQRMIDIEVQELVSLFNGLAQDYESGVQRKSICTTSDKFIIDDLEVHKDLTQLPKDLLDELVDNLESKNLRI